MPLPVLLAAPASAAVAATSTVSAVNLLDAASLLSAFGAIGIAVVMFAETGLLVGFFLPGDSLLFTAGLFCVPGASDAVHLSLWQVLIAAVAGALLGAQTGYVIGRRGGPALLARTRSRKLHEGAARAGELLERYGHAKAVVLARFIPVVRTVLNPLAGALGVPARTFTVWQVAGGTVWSVGLVVAGYGLGSSVPHVDTYLLPIVALIVAVSLAPLALELLRGRRARTAADGYGDTDGHGNGNGNGNELGSGSGNEPGGAPRTDRTGAATRTDAGPRAGAATRPGRTPAAATTSAGHTSGHDSGHTNDRGHDGGHSHGDGGSHGNGNATAARSTESEGM
jgi:membrane-associated protein